MSTRHVRQAGARRRALGLAAVGTAAGVLGIASTAMAGEEPAPEDGEKVTLCHATASKTNPYVVIDVSSNAIVNQVSGKWQGHGKHGDDVIPDFTIARQSPPNPAGLMWSFPGLPEGSTADERSALIANGCFPLGIKKTGTAQVLPGGKVDYEIAVTNVGFGSIPFEAIKVWDYKVPLDPPDVASALKPGETRVWTGSRMAPDSLRMCGRMLKNTAKVTLVKTDKGESSRKRTRAAKRSTQKDRTVRSSTWMTEVICPLDVAIAKSSTQASVEPGGTVNYTVRVTNPGPIPLPTSFISVADPTATTLVEPAEKPDALKQGEYLDWLATKSVAADAAVCGTSVENTASVSITVPKVENGLAKRSRAKRSNGMSQWMPNYTSWPEEPVVATAAGVPVSGGICDNVTPQSTPAAPAATVTAFRPASPAALSVTKTGPARALRGGFVNFRVTLTNTGGATATGVTLVDTPARSMQWRAVPRGAKVSGRTATWAIGDLAAGQSVTKVVRMRMRLSARGRSCNTVVATATGLEQSRARACVTVTAARRPATPVTG